MNPLPNDNFLMIIGYIMVAILFVVMVFGMYRSYTLFNAGRREEVGRIQGLLLGDMLNRLNIPLKRYFHKTNDIDHERHIWKCSNCSNPEQCQKMLLGEDIDPDTFCPNYHELKKL